MLDAYAAHLDRRWAEGCRNAAQLWRELANLGFTGRPTTVRAWAGQRRKGETDAAVDGAVARSVARQPPSAPQIARLLMADTDALPEAEQGFVARLLTEAPGLAAAVAVAKRLNQLLRRHSEEKLGKVLEDAAAPRRLQTSRRASNATSPRCKPRWIRLRPQVPPKARSTASRPSSDPCTAALASTSSAPASSRPHDSRTTARKMRQNRVPDVA